MTKMVDLDTFLLSPELKQTSTASKSLLQSICYVLYLHLCSTIRSLEHTEANEVRAMRQKASLLYSRNPFFTINDSFITAENILKEENKGGKYYF